MARRAWFGVLLLWVFVSAPVHAHSFLQHTAPSPGSVHTTAPGTLTLRFREPAVPRFTAIRVLDASGRVVSGRIRFSADAHQASVALSRLIPGTYTVKWSVLSALDGHTAASSYSFTMAAPEREAQTHSAASSQDPTASSAPPMMMAPMARPSAAMPSMGMGSPDPGSVAAKWAVLLASLTLAGSALFGALVLRPLTLRSGGEETLASAARTVRLMMLASAGALLGCLGAWALLQSGRLEGGGIMAFLTQTRGGWSVLVQGALGSVLLVYALRARTPAPPRLPAVLGAVLLSGGLLSSHSLPLGFFAAVIHWLHLVAISTWLGGLGATFVILHLHRPPARDALASAIVPPFSRFAGMGLAGTAATGVALAVLQVADVAAVLSSLYGRLLLLKVTLLLPAVALGAMIKVLLIPRLREGHARASFAVLRFATGEVGLGIVVIAVSAMLATTTPARMAKPSAPPAEAAALEAADGFRSYTGRRPAYVTAVSRGSVFRRVR